MSVTFAKVQEQEVYPGGEAQILDCGGETGCRLVTWADGSQVRASDSTMDLGEAEVWEYLVVVVSLPVWAGADEVDLPSGDRR